MAKPQPQRFTMTRLTVRSKGKVTSRRCRRRLMENDRTETELTTFWSGKPLEPPGRNEQKESE